MKRIIAAAALCSMAASSLPAQELSLEALIEEALASNPALSELRLKTSAQQARIPQAGALSDPTFMLEMSNVPLSDFDFDSTPMSGRQIGLSQMLPYPGKRADKQRMAEHSAAAVQAEHLDREGLIVSAVKRSYYDLAFFDRAIAITRENEALLEDFVRIAQTKYAVGKGLQQDVLKAQVARSSLKERLIRMQQMRRHAEAELNSALNRPPQEPVGQPGLVTLTPFDVDIETLQQMAIEHRPRLRGIERTIQQWQVAEDLARRELRPDFDISIAYRQRDFDADPVSGSDFVSAGVVLNLPIYRGRKQKQQILEAQLMRQSVEAKLEAARQEIFLQLQKLSVDAEAHRAEAELFAAAIIPQANQSLTAAMAGYQVDKVDFLTLLDSHVKLFDFEIAYYRHLTAHEKTLAKLEAVVGKRLF